MSTHFLPPKNRVVSAADAVTNITPLTFLYRRSRRSLRAAFGARKAVGRPAGSVRLPAVRRPGPDKSPVSLRLHGIRGFHP